MSNQEKYDGAFCSALSVGPDELAGLRYRGTAEWDSVGHMALVAALEDAFGIMLDTDDIIALDSYEAGKAILSKAEYGVAI